MTDLREIVDVSGPGQSSEFVCEATVGSDVLAACALPEGEILRRAAAAVEFEVGMAEIHAGTAAVNDEDGWLHNIGGEAYVVAPDGFEAFAIQEG